MFGNLGIGEILIILVVVLILFGPQKIPELAGTIGRGINQFRRQMDEAQRTVMDPIRGELTGTSVTYSPPPAEPRIYAGFAPPPLTEEEERARQPKRLLDSEGP